MDKDNNNSATQRNNSPGWFAGMAKRISTFARRAATRLAVAPSRILKVESDLSSTSTDAQRPPRHEKRPLQRGAPPAVEFPVDALGEILGGAARAAHHVIQAPMGICGNSVLAAAHLAVQAHADVEIDGRVCPLSEFFITTGETGERKSAVDNAVLKEHRAYEKRLQGDFNRAFGEFKTQSAAVKKDRGDTPPNMQPFDEPDGLTASTPGKPCAPLSPLILCEDPTFQGLVKNLTTGQPSQGLFSDEAGRFLSGFAMNGEQVVATLAGFSKFWDGKPIDRVRVGDGATKIYGRRVSFHLMGQPGVLSRLISDPLAADQGFLSRCLIVVPDSTIGTRFYREADLAMSGPMQRFHARIKGLLDRIPAVEDSADPVLRSELTPRRLTVSTTAKRVYIDYHDTVEREMAGRLKDLKAFANKAPEHLLRIAGALALIENPDAVEIAELHAESARKLIEYYLGEAHRLNELSRQDPELRLAERLLEWLKGIDRPASLVEIYQCGPSSLRNAQRARYIADILVKHGHVRPVDRIMYRKQLRAVGWELAP